MVKAAFEMSALTFVRPGELRTAEWSQINFDTKEWRYLVTKTKVEHIVPLSWRVIEILRDLHQLTGSGKYIFPSGRTFTRPMSDGAVLAALRRIGYTKDEMTAHGFRTMASTLLNELGWNPDAIERQLSHKERNAIRAAYNRAEYLAERRKMMEAWADHLNALAKGGAEIIPITRAANSD